MKKGSLRLRLAVASILVLYAMLAVVLWAATGPRTVNASGPDHRPVQAAATRN